jgi:hypothetical protein
MGVEKKKKKRKKKGKSEGRYSLLTGNITLFSS